MLNLPTQIGGAVLITLSACSLGDPGHAPRLSPPSEAERAMLERDIAAIVEEAGVVTAGVGMISGGELIWAGYFGEERDGVPADSESRFNVASITKSITAETILRLHDEGRLDIDAPMSEHFVDPDLAGDPRLGGLTARVALTHRTGFSNWRAHEEDDTLRFNFDPDTDFGYSGEGFHYLAEWAAAATDTPWPDLVRETTLEPLGLSHLRLGKTDDIVDTTVHVKTEDGAWAEPWCWPWADTCREDGGYSAADDMAISVADYAVFLVSAMRGEGYSSALLADRNTVQGVGDHKTVECRAPGLDVTMPSDPRCPRAQGFGLGYQILDYGEHHVVGHEGGDWHEVTLAYGYDDTLDGVIVFLSGPQENAVRAMPEIIDRLDPDSPMSGQYRRHLAKMETVAE